MLGVLALPLTVVEPYRMARLTGFLNPGSDTSGAGFQAAQAKIALGSGGIFGVGIGNGVQKAFYLPEAHTDMISAVIGEELGLVGIVGVVGLFALFGYAGLQVAKKAKDNYGKLLVAGPHLADPRPGDDQPLRGDGPGAADRRAAALRLLRQQQPAGDALRGRADPQRRPRRDRRALANCASSMAGARPPAKGVDRAVPKRRRVVVAAGGTAGHVVPAMAVADELRASGAEVSFLGTRERIEAELVPAAGYEIDFVKVRGIDRRNPLRAAGAALEALGSVGAARRGAARRAAPTSSWAAAASSPARPGSPRFATGTPLVLTEADSHLGLANRLLAGRARRVCLAFPIDGREGERYLVTGRPVPAAVLAADRDGARERFGIAADDVCLLVMGGSQGARSINDCAIAAFAEREGRDFHVDPPRRAPRLRRARAAGSRPLHIRSATRCSSTSPTSATASPPATWSSGRSGGSIFEVAAAGRPAILVPYPHATADHQSANAAWMAEAGAATVIEDAELSAARLAGGARRAARRRGAPGGDGGRLGGPGQARRGPAYRRRGPRRPRSRSESETAGDDERGRAERDWLLGRRLHFIGIGGAGMSGLALVCARLGATVTGSDRAESSYMERLRAAGLEPAIGHDAANLPEGAEVVVSTAIGEDNPELALARERGLEPIHRGELLAELCAEKRLIAVAGTHGKTTTTAMAVWALRAIGADPAFFVGGEVPGLGGATASAANAGWGEGEWVVAEADESDGSFLRAASRRSRWSPTSRWTTTRAGARSPSCAPPSPSSAAGARLAEFDAGLAGARPSCLSRSPATTTC